MKFTDVTIRNFLSIGEAEFRLDGLGLVMVAGVNNDETSADSNGSGKSSLADAIAWGLWGSTARGVTGDEVINAAAAKDCYVSVTVDDDGEIYRVDRYRKGAGKFKNGLFLYKQDGQGGWGDLTKGTNSLTQKQVERLLGCSEEVFNAAVYSGQEQMPDIPRMTDKQLKTLVEQAAGVDVLTGAYDVARDRLREVAQKRSEAQVEYDRSITRHTDASALIERLSDQSTQWDTDQKVKIANLKQRTLDAKTEYELGQKELDPQGEKELRESISECEGRIAAVNTERQREQVLASDLATAQATLQAVQRKIAAEEPVVAVRSKGVDAAKEALERTKNGVGQPCDDCGRPLTAEHLVDAIANAQAKVTLAEDAYKQALEALAATQAKLPNVEKLVKGAEDALVQHRASMTDVSGEAQKLANLRRELQIIDQAKQEVERLKQGARNIAEQWQRENAAENPFKAMIEQANKDLIARAEECEQKKASAVAAQEEEAYAQAVVDVFAPAGVRAHRLDEATPYLNERTSHYLGSLADGAIEAFWTTLTETKTKGDLREKFSVTVEKAGSAPSFNALSGGEKRKVRLACALALQDLVATRATKNIELMVLDEIDDALDPAGLERLMGVLEEKARDRGTILVVSHNDIKDFVRQSWTVVKTNGRAKVIV